ncbi:YbhB/YbcL family Raf kinase inhibitor-like protein [Chitinispirillales bacterium ANBcel5]|uniref:YbhB/YbcL family Raf kinase inhibitor-like protein n=1 Tax=Cellulosispirillum alkaliphilum TaxID=3039283 RepID=UPI002A5806A4|nr:YbhB/YbcL family Raf kinase inhibitor-like protein [Chitinispirillales bacterium ANBcel5]
MKVSSNAFNDGERIPVKFTCDGDDINPPLNIEQIPDTTVSMVLIMDDPDSLKGLFTHWVVYDIPVISSIDANSIPGKQGLNDFTNHQYGGPCPGTGTHRYFFKIYALDKQLGLPDGCSRSLVEGSMKNHVIDWAQYMGLYSR